MVNRPSTTEFSALLTADEYRERNGELELTPAGADRLALGLRWAKSRGRPVRVSVARFDSVGDPDITSCLIRAEVEAPLARVEATLEAAQLTLGPLSPAARRLNVGNWLTGPHCGLRAIPGGRLESAALALEAVLWTGEVYRSFAAPRSASGPDLDAALLGGEGAMGVLTSATLRSFPRPTTLDRVSLALTEAAQAAAILHGTIAHEALPSTAELSHLDGQLVLTGSFTNLAFRAHRDASRLREVAKKVGATPLPASPAAIDESALTHEFEVSWEALPAVLTRASKSPLGIYRIARDSVVVASPMLLAGEGVVALQGAFERPAWLEALSVQLRGEA